MNLKLARWGFGDAYLARIPRASTMALKRRPRSDCHRRPRSLKYADKVLDTNLRGNFRVAQEAARRMAAHRDGVIVNVASTAALGVGGQLSSYCASKAGLVHLTCVMALELAGKGIRVNALCPGNYETDMLQTFQEKGFDEAIRARTPQRRFGRLVDLDGAALLLASDAGRYITGVALPVDGGQLLSWM